MTMFRLLGPVQVGDNERAVDAGPPRQRTVLAALLVDAGRLVTWDALIDRVWGETPPAGARHSLYSHAARIRRVLEQLASPEAPARLIRLTGGYQLEVDPDLVDAHRFASLVGRARALGEGDAAAALLREALGLWRGEPLAGLTGSWAAQIRQAWRQQHLDATLAWARAELRIGRPATVVGPLTGLVREHPLVEPATALLMRALHDTNRDAEALDCYAGARRRLVKELGAEPGAELREVHQAILRRDVSSARREPSAGDTPHQLPLSARGFAGRSAELARLDAVLAEADEQPAALTIVTLSGMAGVGKTALAVHWAHRAADRFPDGQLYVNLRGFDPSGSAVRPATALRGFLDAFGVPPQRIPARTEAQIALYRSLLAGRRVLIVLDNARNVDQVRPLLPGAPGSLVLVTSRDQLPGLTAAEGAHPIVLAPLPAADARQLLAHRVGAARVAAEPDAVDEIISRCGRLPVALVVAAARAATHPDFPLAATAEELRDAGAILDMLGSADPSTDLRAVFSWSYTTLSRAAARLFRLLALHPGPQIGAPAAASLTGAAVAGVRPLLAELARAHLIIEHTPSRFTLHDLLRAFAIELAHTLESPAERTAATHRMLDHYLLTARAADALLEPHREAMAVGPAVAGVTPEDLGTVGHALDWFTREHAVLQACVDLAVSAGLDTHAWRLARPLSTFRIRQGYWHEQIAAQRLAVAAAERLGDRAGQATAHYDLGRAHIRLRQYDDGHAHLTRARTLFEERGDHNGLAEVHYWLAYLADERGSDHDALRHVQRCRDLYQKAGNRAGQARAANALGLWHNNNGHHELALAYCNHALLLFREVGHQPGETAALDTLGQIHARLGQHSQAITRYQQALAGSREMGDRYNQATILTRIGDTHHAHGDTAAATEAWTLALTSFEELNHPDAEAVRTRLSDAAQTPTGWPRPLTS